MAVAGAELAISSRSFGFHAEYDPPILRLGAQAERYLVADPITAIIDHRGFVEVLTPWVPTKIGTVEPARRLCRS